MTRPDTLTNSNATHMTITSISNDPDAGKVFGFAVTDSGEHVYISGTIVLTWELEAGDVGGGFTAPLVPNPRIDDGVNRQQSERRVCMPIVWDTAPTEVNVFLNQMARELRDGADPDSVAQKLESWL